MSYQSETSSCNEEWDRMSERSSEMVGYERLTFTQRVAKMEEEMRIIQEENRKVIKANRSVNEENRKYKIQIKERDVENKIIAKENKLLKSKIDQNEAVFTVSKWMKEEMEEMQLCNAKLSEKTMDLYKAIWEKEVAKTQSTNSSKRGKLTKEIQKLENLCQKISTDVKKVNKKCLKDIEKHLKSKATTKKPTRKAKISSDDRFIGKYVAANPCFALWNSIEIAKTDKRRKFDVIFTNESETTNSGTGKLSPDNVKRVRTTAWIEGDILYLTDSQKGSHLTLCARVIEYLGDLFVRA